MSSPLLTTKIHIPQARVERVLRPRLVARLQQGLEGKLILVSAPAGYGKTTLICEWLATCKGSIAWVSLDRGDNDPARFWEYLLAALQSAFSASGRTLPEILLQDNPSTSEASISSLINELDKFQQPIILVLDDYHNIEAQAIHDSLSLLAEQAPAHFHLVILTRADPPLPLARLRARSQMVELRLADLRFTRQEAAELLRNVMNLDLSEADLASLESSTEGWVAGLQMAGLSLQGREDASAFIRSFSGENRYILDFLFEEVFQRQPAEIQDFLLRTSVLDQLCESLCNALTLRDDSQTMLNILERSNLFLISLDDRRKWYRYHHLFGDLLRSRLKQTFPEETTLLHQRASDWYFAENNLESAIGHALAGKDFERAASLIELVIKKEEVLNNLVALRSWMERLPIDTLELHPWLCVYRAWVDFETGQRETAEERLQTVEKSIEHTLEAGDPQRQYIQGHIAALRAYQAFTREDIPRVLEMGQRALSLLPADDRMRSSAAVILGAAYWAFGDVMQAEWAFRMAREAALKSSFPRAAPATCYIGVQQVKQGRLQEAIETFRDGLRLATLPNGNETFLAGFPNVKLGDMYRERNHLALASQHLLRGMDQCVHLGQADVLTEAYLCLGRYQLASGDRSGAFETLQKADQAAHQKRVDQSVLCWLDDLRIRLWLAEEDLDAANRWALNSGLSLDGPLSYQHDLHHQNLARVLVAQVRIAGSQSSYEKATSLLSRLRAAAEKAGWVHEEIRFLILQAVNEQAQRKSSSALQSLARAVVLAEPGGYVRVFLDEGDILRGLLVALGKNLQNEKHEVLNGLGISVQSEHLAAIRRYIARLVGAFENVPARPAQAEPGRDVPELIEPPSAREMEVLKLLAEGCADKQIAERLVIARETVHKHLKNIYGKLGVHSRTEAIARAREMGLV
jgi:LuxR family maltose regulon positive regulatory protein